MTATSVQDDDVDLAVRDQWKRYADACTEHMCSEGRHACEDLQRLGALPRQREASP